MGYAHNLLGLVMRNEKGQFMKGYKTPIEMIEKRASKVRGVKRPESQRIKSRETMKKNWELGRMIGVFPTGEKHHWWRGGSTSFCSLLENSREYIRWRTKIFVRDNRTCKVCGNTKNINAHHIKELSSLYQEFLSFYSQFSPIEDKNILIKLAKEHQPFWDIENGETLCEECHKKTLNFGAKQYWRAKNGINQ
jgi:hypothetical protein